MEATFDSVINSVSLSERPNHVSANATSSEVHKWRDVKRGQKLEAETEARALGQGRRQFLEVEAKAQAKDKVMNKSISNVM